MEKSDHNVTKPWDTAVEFNRVCKTYRQREIQASFRGTLRNLFRPGFKLIQALQDVSFQIHQGEMVALAGPNGAGKSTTIKILASLLEADSGEVKVLGLNPMKDRKRYVSLIGVVFGQRTELWWDHPIAASFEWKRVVWNIPRERFNRMTATVTELLDLREFFQVRARELSLGQRMRADLALALLPEPEILFLDEPTLGLDVLAKRNILAFLKTINREKKTTVLVTSHDMSDLEQLASRIIMIDRGKLAFDGDFASLRSEVTDKRNITLELSTLSGEELLQAPVLSNSEHLKSEGNRHTYKFDTRQITVPALISEASFTARILDMEVHREEIDDVIADIYARWMH